MKGIYPRPVVNIIKAINLGYPDLDRDEFRRRILDAVTENLRLDRALFVLADETSRFTDFMVKNIDDLWVQRYKEYYREYDPFELIDRKFNGKLTIRLEELVGLPSFLKSKYYNEFLLPQKIHHKATSYLIYGRKTLGLIGFFRSRCSPAFSDEEMEMISTISPFISNGLELVGLRCDQRLEGDLLDIVQNDSSWGLLIVNESMRPVFMNQNARRVCDDLGESRSCKPDNRLSSLPPPLLEDCQALKQKYCGFPKEKGIGSVYRIIKSQRSRRRYQIRSKIVEKTIQHEPCRLFAVSIDRITGGVRMESERLDEIYGLTERESDILFRLSRGSTNAEIAGDLCICEITVKKHIQRLFEKVGVTNRTALVHRTIIEPSDTM
ncbi:MAG: hypothetical protein CVU64_02065 [Deltaproteobacteria bacterium HGW-Deltaproteobacteria-21]|nr:MAG: hypothetical protein CVU64_02065 [Deltaproteobacteria bacterium HGW-Deltaproteobacteria-21]